MLFCRAKWKKSHFCEKSFKFLQVKSENMNWIQMLKCTVENNLLETTFFLFLATTFCLLAK